MRINQSFPRRLPRDRAQQLRHLVRLDVKELVLKNFAGLSHDQLLERMIEHDAVCRGESEIRLTLGMKRRR